jgi:hypothetical protein
VIIPVYALIYVALVGAALVAFFAAALRHQARQVRPPQPRRVWSQLDAEQDRAVTLEDLLRMAAERETAAATLRSMERKLYHA